MLRAGVCFLIPMLKWSRTQVREESFCQAALWMLLGVPSPNTDYVPLWVRASLEFGFTLSQGRRRGLRLWYTGRLSWTPTPTQSFQWNSLGMVWKHQPSHAVSIPHLLLLSTLPTDKMPMHRQVLSPCNASHVTWPRAVC